MLTKGELGWSATRYAQGGVAAALIEDDDSPELHGSDTLAAGGGLNDADAVRVLAAEGPDRVRELMVLGAHFDRVDGTLALAREGGHSVPRIVHAGGDATGAEIERALSVAVQESGAEVHEGWLATDLLVENGGAAGVIAVDADGTERVLRATHTVIATGGAGQCFAVTTNPPLSTGDGVAMALRAGVAVADLEFMQFHPTALHHPSMPRPLLSEALRGEGAILRDDQGEAFMAAEHPLGDLAPRDVVARAISRRLNERGLDHLWLDATGINGFAAAFPHDLARLPERRSRPHPRLAAGRSGGALPVWWRLHRPRRGDDAPRPLGVRRGGVHRRPRREPPGVELVVGEPRVRGACGRGDHPGQGLAGRHRCAPRDRPRHARGPVSCPRRSRRAAAPIRDELQRIMTRDAGVVRSAESLDRASSALASMVPTDVEEANLLAVSTALVRCRHRALRVAWHAHAFRLPRVGRPTISGGSCSPAIPTPTSSGSSRPRGRRA